MAHITNYNLYILDRGEKTDKQYFPITDYFCDDINAVGSFVYDLCRHITEGKRPIVVIFIPRERAK